jgi:hypothetical protein
MEAIAGPVSDRAELDTVIAAKAREPNGGLIMIPDGFLNVYRAEIVSRRVLVEDQGAGDRRLGAPLPILQKNTPTAIKTARKVTSFAH